jgi:hypothetical protein
MTTTTNTYNKMCELWEQLISRSALKETTRTLLVPILKSMDLYEQDKASNIRQKLFTEICSKLQVSQIIFIVIDKILVVLLDCNRRGKSQRRRSMARISTNMYSTAQ